VIHKVGKNRALVPNPFQNMIYLEGIELTNMYVKFTAINEVTEFLGAAVSTSDMTAMAARVESALRVGGSVEIMFYRGAFYYYERNVVKTIYWRILISLIMMGASGFMSFITFFNIL
jgi:hypothetical protein